MVMVTKTLTIMKDAYALLVDNKLENESFSDEIRGLLSKRKRKKLSDFFGILSEEEGAEMLEVLEKKRAMNIELMKDDRGLRLSYCWDCS